MASLPQSVALMTDFNNSFVALVTNGSRKNCLEMSSEVEMVVNPKAKFAVEPSTGGLVHIRSTYNSRYLCSESENSDFIAAIAVEKVEDKSAWNCTLFRIRFYGQHVSLYHVGSNIDVQVSSVEGQLMLNHAKEKSHIGSKEIFTAIDLSSIVVLPKLVTFLSFVNGRYLRGRWIEHYQYNEFSAEDINNKETYYEIFATSTGEIRVKSEFYEKYWRRSPNWIYADSTDTTTDNPDTLFKVFKLDDNVIALRNGGNRKFCKRLTTEGKKSCLNAGATSMELETRLVVIEPVISRKVEVQFRLEDARIYNKKPIIVSSTILLNKTTVEYENLQGMTYEKTQVSTWSNNISLTTSVNTEFKTGIPNFYEGKIEIGPEISKKIEFGQSNDFSKEVKSEYKVIIPPMTKVTILVLGTEAMCDIPFSYLQTDLLTNGNTVSSRFNDGTYKAVESYGFQYETIYESM